MLGVRAGAAERATTALNAAAITPVPVVALSAVLTGPGVRVALRLALCAWVVAHGTLVNRVSAVRRAPTASRRRVDAVQVVLRVDVAAGGAMFTVKVGRRCRCVVIAIVTVGVPLSGMRLALQDGGRQRVGS